MKKLLKATILLGGAIILSMGIAACGSDEDENGTATVPTQNFEDDAIVLRDDAELRITAPQLASILPNEEIAVMRTNHGNIYIRFFPEQAPLAVESFLGHARSGFYDDVIFHRVVEGFMIQGGCPDGMGTGGTTYFGYAIDVEPADNLVHIRGALSMANTGVRYSTGSQFFIVQCTQPPLVPESRLIRELGEDLARAYIEHGGRRTYHLDGRHTVFGQVFRGMDVVDAIANVAVAYSPGQTPGNPNDPPSRPVADVVILGIDVMLYSELS